MTVRSVLVAAILMGALTGCGGDPPSPTPAAAILGEPFRSSEPTTASAQQGEFHLAMTVARTILRAGEEIRADAALWYVGGPPRIEITASGSGVVAFALEELDGDRDMGISATSDCETYALARDRPMVSPFAKTAAIGSRDPHRDFWREYIADPVLRLPPGRWRLSAIADFYTGGCGGQRHFLQTGVEVTVLP